MLARYSRSNNAAIIVMASVTAMALAWALTRPTSVVFADSSKLETISARMYEPNCANPIDRETADLCAQQEMAWWAQLMTITTAVSVLISAGGVVLLLATLRQNRSALRIGMASLKRSNQSVRLAERQLIADSRPWVKVEKIVPVGPFRFTQDGEGKVQGSLSIDLILKNVGKTPALNVLAYTRFRARPFIAASKLRDEFVQTLSTRAEVHIALGQTIFPDDTQRMRHHLTLFPPEIAFALKHFQYPGKPAIAPEILVCIAYDMPSTGATHETGLIIHVGKEKSGGEILDVELGEIAQDQIVLSRTVVGGYVT